MDIFMEKKPNAFIESCASNFKKAHRFLCLGEGEGRNAVYFAKRGFEVAAIDASDIALKKLEEFAKEEGVYVKTRCRDLNEWTPKKKIWFDNCLLFTYVQRG